jgi:aminoglycoside/choline kinase family phosphotransferase
MQQNVTVRNTTAKRREETLHAWLQALGQDCGPARLLAADASFRRYFRVQCREGTRIIMDAPPPQEDTQPFLRIASLLQMLGLRSPGVHATHPEGFLLLEDFGDQTFTRALAAGIPETTLYTLASAGLHRLQATWQLWSSTAVALTSATAAVTSHATASCARTGHPAAPEPGDGSRRPRLPADPCQPSSHPGFPALHATLTHYTTDLLLQEAGLLLDWYWPDVHGAPPEEAVRQDFVAAWQRTLAALPVLPTTLVLRDFHVDNLMLLEGADATLDCGWLDFQDAVLGSPAYDWVSLLRDARRDVSVAVQQQVLAHLLQSGLWPKAAFLHHYRVLGAQRTTKIIGIFVRLARRDGKSAYLPHLPRLWRLLQEDLEQPELQAVSVWFRQHFRTDGAPLCMP